MSRTQRSERTDSHHRHRPGRWSRDAMMMLEDFVIAILLLLVEVFGIIWYCYDSPLALVAAALVFITWCLSVMWWSHVESHQS